MASHITHMETDDRLGASWSGSDSPWVNAAWDSKKKGRFERTL